MQDTNSRIKALEDKVAQNEQVLDTLWAGLRVCLRGLSAAAAGNIPTHELNKYYRRNQNLFESQERRRRLAAGVCMLAPDAKTSGGVVPARGTPSPKKNEPEVGR